MKGKKVDENGKTKYIFIIIFLSKQNILLILYLFKGIYWMPILMSRGMLNNYKLIKMRESIWECKSILTV